MIKDFSDFDHANNSQTTEATDIPRVSEFFSIKEDNISFAMNESLLDKDTKKTKNSLFSKIVNVGFKKKELNNDLVNTNEQYSQVAMNADSKILSDNEVSDLNNEVDNPFDNEFLSDDKAQFDDFQTKIENELNEDQISNPLQKDEYQNQFQDDLLNENTDEATNSEQIEDDIDNDIEIPSFLKRQAN